MSLRNEVERVFDFQNNRIAKLNNRIAKLESALQFYANVDNHFAPSTGDWDSDNPSEVELDAGNRARIVLYGD